MSATEIRPARARRAEPRWTRVVVRIGIVLAALGVILVAANLLFFSLVRNVEPWETDVTVRGGLFALSSSEIEQLLLFIAVPGILFVLALCFIFTGRVLRGGLGSRETNGRARGTVVSHNDVLAPRAHLAWLAVALAFWAALVIVPALSALGGGWPSTIDDVQHDYLWTTLGLYGGLAAAVAAVLLTSFLKKRRYLAMVEAEDERLLQEPSGLWRWVTFRWRFDLWIAGVGGTLAGLSWLLLLAGEVPAFAACLAGGILLLALGVWTAAQYWRAGVPLGVAESFS